MHSIKITLCGIFTGYLSLWVSPTAITYAYSAISSKANPSESSTSTPSSSSQQARHRTPRPAPPRRLPPNRVQPGGGLDAEPQACSNTMEALTALIPVENPVSTRRAYPSFWFYIPDSPDTVRAGEFIVLSADEKEQIYAAPVALPQASGILRVQLPATPTVGLVEDTAYHWYFNLTCQSTDGSETVLSVNGWVYRTEAVELSQTDSQSTEFWYDALDQAALHLLHVPQSINAQQTWANLLTEVGLEGLVNKPIVSGGTAPQPLEPVPD